MKNFSNPPYSLHAAGEAIDKLGNLIGVNCVINPIPSLKAEGAVSLTALAEDVARIADKFGLDIKPSCNVADINRSLQRLINELAAKGIINPNDL